MTTSSVKSVSVSVQVNLTNQISIHLHLYSIPPLSSQIEFRLLEHDLNVGNECFYSNHTTYCTDE